MGTSGPRYAGRRTRLHSSRAGFVHPASWGPRAFPGRVASRQTSVTYWCTFRYLHRRTTMRAERPEVFINGAADPYGSSGPLREVRSRMGAAFSTSKLQARRRSGHADGGAIMDAENTGGRSGAAAIASGRVPSRSHAVRCGPMRSGALGFGQLRSCSGRRGQGPPTAVDAWRARDRRVAACHNPRRPAFSRPPATSVGRQPDLSTRYRHAGAGDGLDGDMKRHLLPTGQETATTWGTFQCRCCGTAAPLLRVTFRRDGLK